MPQHNLKPSSFKEAGSKTAQVSSAGMVGHAAASGDVEMIRQCLSILATGRAPYVGYNWWGHAGSLRMEWDEAELNGVVVVQRAIATAKTM